MEMSASARAGLANLPRELSPLEEALRDQLVTAAKTADKLLAPLGSVTIQDWIEARVPAELRLGPGPGGRVVLALQGRTGKATRDAPMPMAEKGEEALEAFFAGLPEASFLEQEDRLRDALLAVLARGPMPVAKVASNQSVQPAHRALARSMRVPLEDWIERRIGSEVEVYEDESKRIWCRLADDDGGYGFRKEQREAFLADLPMGRLTAAEEDLRHALFGFLAAWTSPNLARLSHAGADEKVREAKSTLLPKEVSFRDWIYHRLDHEVLLKKDPKGQLLIDLTKNARDRVAEMAAGAVARESRGQKRQDFFDSLPSTGLSQSERALHQSLVDFLKSWQHGADGAAPPTLSHAGTDPDVKARRADLLPQGITLKDWIERRAPEDFELTPDDRSQLLIALRGAGGRELGLSEADREAARAERKEASAERKEAFFAGLPDGNFSSEESDMREVLLNLLESWEGPRAPTMSNLGSDPTVREARAKLLPKGVALREWIEARIGGEIQLAEIEGSKEVAVGLVGEELDVSARDGPNSSRRRRVRGTGASVASAGGGKSGKGGNAPTAPSRRGRRGGKAGAEGRLAVDMKGAFAKRKAEQGKGTDTNFGKGSKRARK